MKKKPKPAAPTKTLALPKIWTEVQIFADASSARTALIARRKSQIKSELDDLKGKQFPSNTAAIEDAIACLEVVMQSSFDTTVCQNSLSSLIKNDVNDSRKEALRYLAYPPISKDDLEATAEIISFTKKTIDAKPNPKCPTEIPDMEAAKRVMETIAESLDTVRFEWLVDPHGYKAAHNNPADLIAARKFAVESTAMMLSAQQTQTSRRSNEKSELESQVRAILIEEGFTEKPKEKLSNSSDLHNALASGEFMKECTVATENADFVVRLRDGRFLFIECKASNSEINSRKRLNKEATKNIQVWQNKFGSSIVGSCSIRGIFKPEYVIEAQNQGVYIFWGHNLEALTNFLKAAN